MQSSELLDTIASTHSLIVHRRQAVMSSVRASDAPVLETLPMAPAVGNLHLMRITKSLRESGQRELAQVRLSLSAHALYIDGQVTSFYLKQLAQETVRPHMLGLRICNRLQVDSDLATLRLHTALRLDAGEP